MMTIFFPSQKVQANAAEADTHTHKPCLCFTRLHKNGLLGGRKKRMHGLSIVGARQNRMRK